LGNSESLERRKQNSSPSLQTEHSTIFDDGWVPPEEDEMIQPNQNIGGRENLTRKCPKTKAGAFYDDSIEEEEEVEQNDVGENLNITPKDHQTLGDIFQNIQSKKNHANGAHDEYSEEVLVPPKDCNVDGNGDGNIDLENQNSDTQNDLFSDDFIPPGQDHLLKDVSDYQFHFHPEFNQEHEGFDDSEEELVPPKGSSFDGNGDGNIDLENQTSDTLSDLFGDDFVPSGEDHLLKDISDYQFHIHPEEHDEIDTNGFDNWIPPNENELLKTNSDEASYDDHDMNIRSEPSTYSDEFDENVGGSEKSQGNS
jgi:hypothetical protein